jgi:hypothetical protein
MRMKPPEVAFKSSDIPDVIFLFIVTSTLLGHKQLGRQVDFGEHAGETQIFRSFPPLSLRKIMQHHPHLMEKIAQ